MVLRIWYSPFKYQVMLFGLTNIQTTFQSYINKILIKKLDIFIIVYLNNILIYTKSEREKLMEVFQWVLDQLQKSLLYINFKKYWFY